MVVGGYLITSIHMRIADEKGSDFSQYIGPTNSPQLHYPLSPLSLKERCERVFKMVPKKMKNLVLVNSALSTFDFIQACVEVADKYSDHVIVIPPLLALLTFALEEISIFKNPPLKEVVLVVTLAPEFYDFTILRRDRDFVMYVAEFEHYEVLGQFKEKFAKIYDYAFPHSTIFLAHETVYDFAKNFRSEFNPENCFIKTFKQWHYVLLYGSMLRAMGEEEGYDTRYHITNFSHGYELSVYNYRNRTKERHVLLPARSSLPCDIRLQYSIPPSLSNIYYSAEYYQVGSNLVSTKFDTAKRKVSKSDVVVSGSKEQVIGYIDERGIPYLINSAEYKNRVLPKPNEAKEIHDPDVAVQIPPESANGTNLSYPTASSSVNCLPDIKFIFRENFYAIEVLQNGSSKFLTDSFGNKWTPLYLSMAESTVEIGETAKKHYSTFPKYVIYDTLEIIGKPLNEIINNQKWGFELADRAGIVYFQIETHSGPRLISPEMVFAAFLKAMKLQIESYLNRPINEIRLCTNFELTESQKDIFVKASAKNNLEIISFDAM
uniref:Uncharacterized protein n=1 Tax=Panagrolaimus sp. ES5 TaxID=591445 RepID=A0AC34FZ13_9BILA